MRMSISRETVRHIADLSYLRLSEDETTAFQKDLSAILDYIQTLNRADVSDVTPLEHAYPQPTPYRDDSVAPSLSNDQLLKNVPKPDPPFISVPKVLP
jgi:aspartyl-tRNA(Asn)/glutamyl-tRNA(Gln) amidotransferase subunit C